MQPSFVIIGLNYRTAPLEVRERFWISEARRYEALHQLVRSEGIDEAVVLSTPYRTDFILWASDASSAANSVLRFLAREYDLKLCEWSHFYRLLDDAALTHLFRLAATLDTVVVGDQGIFAYLGSAWDQANKAGTVGTHLRSIYQAAVLTGHRVRSETEAGSPRSSAQSGVLELATQVIPDLRTAKVVLFGSGILGEFSAKAFGQAGAEISVINRIPQRAQEVAARVDAAAVNFNRRWQVMSDADVVLSATSCPHPILLRDHIEELMARRLERPLAIFDLSVPRDVEPSVSEVPNVRLWNVQHLEKLLLEKYGRDEVPGAHDIVAAEVGRLRLQFATPDPQTLSSARTRLDEVCHQELEMIREELGPFTEDQEQALERLAANITQRIASHLARELQAVPERTQREQLSLAIERLFNVEKTTDVEQRAVNR